MDFVIWLVMGGLVGWLASIIMGTNGRQSIALKMVIGIVSAVIGGVVVGPLLDTGSINEGFSVMSLIVSLIGAVLLLFALGLLRRDAAD